MPRSFDCDTGIVKFLRLSLFKLVRLLNESIIGVTTNLYLYFVKILRTEDFRSSNRIASLPV